MFVKMKLSFASFVHKIRAIEGGKFMLKFGQFLLRNFLNLLIAMTTLMICNWSFDINFWISSLLAIVSYLLSNIIIKNIQYLRYLKRNGLNRSEYKHIQEQLAEAYSLLKNLNRNYTKLDSNYNFEKGLWEKNGSFTITNLSGNEYGTTLITKTREGIDRSERS